MICVKSEVWGIVLKQQHLDHCILIHGKLLLRFLTFLGWKKAANDFIQAFQAHGDRQAFQSLNAFVFPSLKGGMTENRLAHKQRFHWHNRGCTSTQNYAMKPNKPLRSNTSPRTHECLRTCWVNLHFLWTLLSHMPNPPVLIWEQLFSWTAPQLGPNAWHEETSQYPFSTWRL